MSKRYGKVYDTKESTPSKKPKLEVTITASQQVVQGNKPLSPSKNEPADDPWGADFNDEDIEEMDFAASQASSKSVETYGNVVTELKPQSEFSKPSSSASYANSKPSTSRSNTVISSTEQKKFETKIPSQLNLPYKNSSQANNNVYGNQPSCNTASINPKQMSQQISSSKNQTKMFTDEQSVLFDDFTDNLLKVNNHNSTFQSQVLKKSVSASGGARTVNISSATDAINISDDSILRQLEKLKLENKKLLDSFMTKEGETAFLRSQLQQTQNRAEHDKIEKAKQIEEQANQYRSKINQAIKKEETLRTQLEFQTLQLNSLQERCKFLESGSVKFAQPHTASLDSSLKNRLNTTLNRASPSVKTVHVVESGVQTMNFNLRKTYRLKRTVEIYPLSEIPQSIFEPSQSEPPVVEIQIIEKVGTKNLPILQDERNIRIFENPDLVKPIVTMINNQTLNTEFCLPDIAVLMKKTDVEINGHNMFPAINKLVAVARELLLNTTLVLQRISSVIQNDDIRDMNDVYFSDFYKMHVDSTKSICDSNAWHNRERGIEARRSLAILSYIAPVSNYLSECMTGKRAINILNDPNYENYIKQMNSYNEWPKKGCKFEVLELILEFVSTVGYVRRSHQFSGLIVAILKLLIGLKGGLVSNEKGIDYAYKILKEIVFGRPLLVCYSYITELLMTFSSCAQFCKKLCTGTTRPTMTVWKDELHFTSDACLIQIYVAQLEFFQPDPVTTVDITYALVNFVSNIITSNDITWINQRVCACKCSMKLFGLTLYLLHKCSKVNLDEPLQKQNYKHVASFNEQPNRFSSSDDTRQETPQNIDACPMTTCSNILQLDKNVKIQSKHKKLLTIRKGIMFLCYLSTWDPDFIIRLSDIEDSFNLFMQQIESLDDLKLNETERAALSSVKATFVFDKTASSEGQSDKNKKYTEFKVYSEFKDELLNSNRQQIVKSYNDSISNNQQISNDPSWLSEFIYKKQKTINKSVSQQRQNTK